MSDRQTVEVLLATYNGERYLRKQIDSTLTQDYADLRVLARDDGFSDGTAGILNEYAERIRAPSRGFHTLRGTASKIFLFLFYQLF